MISIIIPVFQMNKYFLDKCIDSIVSQTYKNFEILIIDDGSDQTFCETYSKIAEKDERILFHHLAKKGVSNARNFGLSKAKGEWVLFVDGDDWLTDDALMIFEHWMQSSYDMIFGRNYYCQSDNFYSNFYSGDAAIRIDKESKNDFIETIFYGKSRHFSSGAMPWGKLYRTSFLRDNEICFPENIKIGEDACFNLQVICKANVVMAIDEFVYNYRKHDNAVSCMEHDDMIEICSLFFNRINEILHEFKMEVEYEEAFQTLIFRYWEMYLIKRYLKTGRNTLKKIKSLKRTINDPKYFLLWDIGGPFKGKRAKMKAWMIRHHCLLGLAVFHL